MVVSDMSDPINALGAPWSHPAAVVSQQKILHRHFSQFIMPTTDFQKFLCVLVALESAEIDTECFKSVYF